MYQNPLDPTWFPAKVTTKSGSGSSAVYGVVHLWLEGNLGNHSVGNMPNVPVPSTTDLAGVCVTGDDLSVGDHVLARPAFGAGGTLHEVIPVGAGGNAAVTTALVNFDGTEFGNIATQWANGSITVDISTSIDFGIVGNDVLNGNFAQIGAIDGGTYCVYVTTANTPILFPVQVANNSAGWVGIGDQTFLGIKTFHDDLNANGTIYSYQNITTFNDNGGGSAFFMNYDDHAGNSFSAQVRLFQNALGNQTVANPTESFFQINWDITADSTGVCAGLSDSSLDPDGGSVNVFLRLRDTPDSTGNPFFAINDMKGATGTLSDGSQVVGGIIVSIGGMMEAKAAAPPPTVAGSRSNGTALASLLTALASLGIIVDGTTP